MPDETKYFSASKGQFISIAPMPTPHLSSAAKKLAVAIANGDDSTDLQQPSALTVLLAMIDVLAGRVPPQEARA